MTKAARSKSRKLSALEILDLEEERTLLELRSSLVAAGEDLLGLDEAREAIRRHPAWAMAGSAALGALLAPTIVRLARVAWPFVLSIGQKQARSRSLDGFVRQV